MPEGAVLTFHESYAHIAIAEDCEDNAIAEVKAPGRDGAFAES